MLLTISETPMCWNSPGWKGKEGKEVDATFRLVTGPDCFPMVNDIAFFCTFLPKTMPILPYLHTQEQNKRPGVWVPEFSFCGPELKGSSRTCTRSQSLEHDCVALRHVPVCYSASAFYSEGNSRPQPQPGSRQHRLSQSLLHHRFLSLPDHVYCHNAKGYNLTNWER